MAKRLEKKRPILGNEIETKLFIYHVKKLFPDISIREIRKFIAKYLGIKVGYQWIMYRLNEIDENIFMLTEGGQEDEITKKIEESVVKSVAQITEDSRLAVKEIVADSQMMAKNIKGKMMEEIDVRLDGDTDGFSNDELIRGSKIMHDIEYNTPENQPININFNIDEFNQVYHELNKRKQEPTTESVGAGKETPVVDGEI